MPNEELWGSIVLPEDKNEAIKTFVAKCTPQLEAGRIIYDPSKNTLVFDNIIMHCQMTEKLVAALAQILAQTPQDNQTLRASYDEGVAKVVYWMKDGQADCRDPTAKERKDFA
jgi:hypothetical protein